MIKPKIPANENERQEELKSYSILDTLPEEEFDEITLLASQICGTPISLISLLDDKRQWFKSHHGTSITESAKDVAFCAHAINEEDKHLIVNDSREDKRFFDNPIVTDGPKVIFYAGVSLVTSNGFALGTLCVIDKKPNKLNDSQIQALQALSNQVMKLLELRKNKFELERKNKAIADSINYSEKIQHSILPQLSEIKKRIPNSFVYFEPKDKIGGDFYYYFAADNYSFIATVDCTGHGIPGALMSMAVYSLLNEIVMKELLTDPGEILTLLHEKVTLALQQEKGDEYSQNGCDATLCRIDLNSKELVFSGAFNDLLIYNGKEYKTLKADHQSIGGVNMLHKFEAKRVFNSQTISIASNDLILLVTDGIPDQLNTTDEAYGVKELKKIMKEMYTGNTADMKSKITKSIKDWKTGVQQQDDLLLFGFKVAEINEIG